MSRFLEAFPMPNQKTKTVAKILVEDICCRYGTLKLLLTDRGTNFRSELLEEVTNYLKIKRIYTSPYHPQTDGLTERFNRTLKDMLSCYVNRLQTDWDKHIK